MPWKKRLKLKRREEETDENDKTDGTDDNNKKDKTDEADRTAENEKKDQARPPDKTKTRPDKEDHDVKNEPKNKAVEHVIQPHPDLPQEQVKTQLELLTGGYTDADGTAAKLMAYEAFAQDTNEPKHERADDGEFDKTDRTDRKDGSRAREEQGRADDGRADGGRARKGRAKTVAGFVGTT